MARPSQAKKREAILDAATELFLESGYSRVSVDAIVAKVGGSKRTIYAYFGDKDGLFSALISHLCQKHVAPLVSLDLIGLAPDHALRKMADAFFDVLLAPHTLELHRLVVAESPHFPDAGRAFFAAAPSISYRCLSDYFAWAENEGLIKPGSAYNRARLFLDSLTGDIQLRCLLGLVDEPDKERLRALSDEAIDIFLDGIGYRRDDPA
ncbi:TetR/AcrR family transcriptional regulator [Halomonas organivorans]